MRYRAPTLILTFSFSLFRVGLCPHGKLPFQDAWLHQSRRRGLQDVDHVDPSPHDRQSKHVREFILSDRDQRAHRLTRGCNGND